MKKMILVALLATSFNCLASISERAGYRNELESALDNIQLNSVEATNAKSTWYIQQIWIEFTPYVAFKVPGLAGLKITPNVRIFLKRNLKTGYQDYKPTTM